MSVIRDCAIRIRTLGRKPGAAILSIGAVFFDRRTGKLGSDFYKEIGVLSAIRGSALDSVPLDWWKEHSDEAAALIERSKDKVPLATALENLCSWMRNASAGVPIVWTFGVNDITVLEEAFVIGAVGLSEPWHYSNIRSYLTLHDATYMAVPKVSLKMRTTPNANALDSAKDTAGMVVECFNALRKLPAMVEDDEL
jgi:hypothetical protein